MGTTCCLCGYEVYKDAKEACAPLKKIIESNVCWVHTWCVNVMRNRSVAEAQRDIQTHIFKGTAPPCLGH